MTLPISVAIAITIPIFKIFLTSCSLEKTRSSMYDMNLDIFAPFCLFVLFMIRALLTICDIFHIDASLKQLTHISPVCFCSLCSNTQYEFCIATNKHHPFCLSCIWRFTRQFIPFFLALTMQASGSSKLMSNNAFGINLLPFQ